MPSLGSVGMYPNTNKRFKIEGRNKNDYTHPSHKWRFDQYNLDEILISVSNTKNEIFLSGARLIRQNEFGENKRTDSYLTAAGSWPTPTKFGLLMIELHQLLKGAGSCQFHRVSHNWLEITSQERKAWQHGSLYELEQREKRIKSKKNYPVVTSNKNIMLASVPHYIAGCQKRTNHRDSDLFFQH